ncbi:MAG TPA: O-antigen ligase family protein [Vineibacter sp.]|nr:O-antigen ligase family protein [Vineibacter sp.]
MSSILYWALLGIVCLAPLPLASNRPLPWSVLSLAVGALLLLWGIGQLIDALRRGPVREMPGNADATGRLAHARLVDRYALLLVLGFSILIAWYWVQASPALSGGWAHAAWAEAGAALGTALPAAASLDPAAGETLIMKIVAYGGIFLLAFEMGRDRNRARLGFWAVCLAGFAYAVYGLFVQFTGDRTVLWFAKDAYPESVTSTFINRNAYATYAGMAVLAGLVPLVSEVRRLTRERLTPLRFLLALSERTSPSLYLVIAATITGLVAIALTGSRAGVACFALALVVFAVGLLIAREIRLRTFLVGAAVGSGVIVTVLLLSGDFLVKRLVTETAPEARASVFDVARLAVAEEPWIGHGLGGFGPAFNRANDGRAVFETYVDLAHNTYLELAVEGGIPALLLSLALIGGAVGICFAGVMSRGRNATLSIAAVAIATMVGAHATVDFGIQMPAVAATFMLLMGVATAQALMVEKSEPRFESRRAHSTRRFGRSRPHRADEAVTPPPELEIAWPVRSTAPVLPAPARMAAPGMLQPLSRMQDDEARPPAASQDGPASADEYESAMARWRALRQVGADDAAAPGDAVPITQPDTRSAETESPPVDEPPDGSTPHRAKVVPLPRTSRP